MTENLCETNMPQIRFSQYSNQWVKRPLSSIATMHARIGWQNLRTTEFLEDGDYLLVTGTDFIDGTINYDTCHYVEKIRYEQDKNIQIHDDSILITKDGTLGKVAFVRGLKCPATLNAGVFNVVVRDNLDSDPQYLFYYVSAPFLMKYVDKKAIGGTIKHLNQNILVDFPIMQPPLVDEQKKIGYLLRQIDNHIESEEEKYETLIKFKEACLQKMFPKKGNFPEIRLKGFSKKWEWVKVSSFCDISTGESNTQDQETDGDYPFYIRSRIPVKT